MQALAAWVWGRHRPGDPYGVHVQVWGLYVPPWLAVCSLLSAVVVLVLLVQGPWPWRATRWAWFWLISNPLTLLAFLLLSGPTPGVRAPRDAGRRLGGGWAFVISSVCGTAWLHAT